MSVKKGHRTQSEKHGMLGEQNLGMGGKGGGFLYLMIPGALLERRDGCHNLPSTQRLCLPLYMLAFHPFR